MTDNGPVRSALTARLEVHEFAANLRAPKINAVVHFAAIPRIMLLPDNEAYRTNTTGTYNIIEAAEKLGHGEDDVPILSDSIADTNETSPTE